MHGRIAVSAYCHALVLGFTSSKAREIAERVFLELDPDAPADRMRSTLDHEIAAVELRYGTAMH